jgi:hypothetical protein
MRRRDGVGLAAALVWGTVLAATAADAAEREVLVLRGRGSPPPKPWSAEAPSVHAVAGERLWLVDGERLLACRLERTTRVSERRIRCAGRRLPQPGG